MAAAENAPVTPPAAQPKAEKPRKSPEQRKEARAALLQLLLIVLVGVAIVWLGLDIVIGVIALVLFVIGRFFGVGG